MAIKPNELRIGNIVDLNGSTVQITEFHGQTSNKYQPIKITKDWLYKFGFSYGGTFDKADKFYIGVNPITYDYLFDLIWLDEREYPFYKNAFHLIKYVHSLQNIYFALTGKELHL